MELEKENLNALIETMKQKRPTNNVTGVEINYNRAKAKFICQFSIIPTTKSMELVRTFKSLREAAAM